MNVVLSFTFVLSLCFFNYPFCNEGINEFYLEMKRYERDFTVLDFDGKSLSVAVEFPNSVFVLLSDDKDIFSQCKKSDFKNVILLNHPINSKLLEALAKSEHFDIVIAEKNLGPLDLFSKLGEHVFLKDSVLQTKKSSISNVCLGYPSEEVASYKIVSNYKEKYLIKKRFESFISSEWLPGINLVTFRELNGVYPSIEMLMESIYLLKDVSHDDCQVFNLVIQGAKIAAIDQDDPKQQPKGHFPCCLAIDHIIHYLLTGSRKYGDVDIYGWPENIY